MKEWEKVSTDESVWLHLTCCEVMLAVCINIMKKEEVLKNGIKYVWALYIVFLLSILM